MPEIDLPLGSRAYSTAYEEAGMGRDCPARTQAHRLSASWALLETLLLASAAEAQRAMNLDDLVARLGGLRAQRPVTGGARAGPGNLVGWERRAIRRRAARIRLPHDWIGIGPARSGGPSLPRGTS